MTLEVKYTETEPRRVGHDDGGPPLLVIATGYAHGFRLGEVGWAVGEGLDAEIARGVLVPYDDSMGDGTGPLVDPGMVRQPDYIAALGITPTGATSADVTALTEAATHDPDAYVEGGPTSIHTEQSDQLASRAARPAPLPADSAAIADSNAHEAQFVRDPNVDTYDLDAEPVKPAAKRRTRG